MKFLRFGCYMALLIAAGTCSAQNNPVPFIDQPLVPSAVEPSGPDVSLTVNGAGFVSGSVVNWNGHPLVTTFVNAGILTALVPAAYVSKDGTARVTVINPGPGGGSSDPAPFTITVPPSSLSFRQLSNGGQTGRAAALADFNNDGIADLAVIDDAPSCKYEFWGSGGVAIHLGNGNGTFSKVSTLCVPDILGAHPAGITLAGDVNRDGNVDLVQEVFYVDFGQIAVIYNGNGDGTFTAAPNGQLGVFDIRGLILGDFNNDGKLNIAVSELADITPWAGVFLFPELNWVFYSLTEQTGTLAAGDFNGDGLLDLADYRRRPLGSSEPGRVLTTLINKGNRVFTKLPDVPLDGGDQLMYPPLVSGDFNGDGSLDIATVDGDTISVLLGKGDGTFIAKTGQPVSAQNNLSMIAADVNGDGKLDLVVADSASTVSIWLGNGDGTFQAPVDTTGRGNTVMVADLTGDGRMDLVVSDPDSDKVSILLQGPPYKALVESPIDPDGGSVFSAKRGIVPVKFTLTENGVATCAMPPATIAVTRTVGANPGAVDQGINENPADIGSNFRIDQSACQYVFNLATRSLGIGMYRVDIRVNGYVIGHSVFRLQ